MYAPSVTVSRGRIFWKIFWWIFKFGLAALFIALPIRWFVAQPILVSGASMEPTLMPNEYIVVDKLSYRMHQPERGDVIVMRYPLNPSVFFVKRIIGMPGETISIAKGVVTILRLDGVAHVLDEPYLELPDSEGSATTTLADDEYFVLGDNRKQSSDSREWGPLQDKFIVGRAYVRLFPFDNMSLLPGQHRYTFE